MKTSTRTRSQLLHDLPHCRSLLRRLFRAEKRNVEQHRHLVLCTDAQTRIQNNLRSLGVASAFYPADDVCVPILSCNRPFTRHQLEQDDAKADRGVAVVMEI